MFNLFLKGLANMVFLDFFFIAALAIDMFV